MTRWRMKTYGKQGKSYMPGASNENIVQNHLKIALLNVFQYLNGRYRHFSAMSLRSAAEKTFKF